MLIKELFHYGMLNIISVYSSNFKNTLINIKKYMIKIERNCKNINIIRNVLEKYMYIKK